MRWRAAATMLLAATGLVRASAPAAADLGPATTQSAADPNLMTKLIELDRRIAQVQDLTTHFQQRKFTPLLKKPLLSTGTVRIKGSRMRWDTEKPSPSVLHIDEREIRLYYPQQKAMEVYGIAQQLARLAATPLPRLEVLRAHFSFQQVPAHSLSDGADERRYLGLSLTPLDTALRQHVAQVRVLLDLQTACMVAMETTDTDGDRTVITFQDPQINTGISDAEMELRVPPDTAITRPLEAFGGDTQDQSP